jgi:hypothetical protein
VGRVAADPARVPAAIEPGGWRGTAHLRLHGSPRRYYSAYDAAALDALAARLRPPDAPDAPDAPGGHIAAPPWCVFDNTALGAATPNAVDLLERLAAGNAERTPARWRRLLASPPPPAVAHPMLVRRPGMRRLGNPGLGRASPVRLCDAAARWSEPYGVPAQ